MKNYIKTGLLLLFPSFIWAQNGLLNNGAAIEVTKNTAIHIVGNIHHQANGKIINEGIIKVEKDWVQTGKNTLYTGLGWMSFVGENNQEISSTSPMTIPNLRVDNSNMLLLNTDLAISNQVDLSYNGNIKLGTSNLIMNDDGTIVNYDADHHIITNDEGALQQAVGAHQVLFPIGNQSYNPAIISNEGTLDNFRLRVLDEVKVAEKNVVDRTWLVEEETIGGSLVSLGLQWNENEALTGFDRNQSAVVKWTGTEWDHSANPKTANSIENSWIQTATNLTSFSAFNVRSTTLSSSISEASITTTIDVFPNPLENHLTIRLDANVKEAFIQIFDSKGSLVLEKNKQVGDDHLIHLANFSHFSSGVYWINIIDNNNSTFSQKIVKK